MDSVIQPDSKKSRFSCFSLGMEMTLEWLKVGVRVFFTVGVLTSSTFPLFFTEYFTMIPLENLDLWMFAFSIVSYGQKVRHNWFLSFWVDKQNFAQKVKIKKIFYILRDIRKMVKKEVNFLSINCLALLQKNQQFLVYNIQSMKKMRKSSLSNFGFHSVKHTSTLKW